MAERCITFRSKIERVIVALSWVACPWSAASEPISPREVWLESQVKYLEECKVSEIPDASVTKVELDAPDRDGCLLLYHTHGNGLLRFASGEWAVILAHSFHAMDGIGDVVLARTSTGKYYVNHGHPCPWLTVRSKTKVLSLKDFLNTLGGPALDGSRSFRWSLLKAPRATAKK